MQKIKFAAITTAFLLHIGICHAQTENIPLRDKKNKTYDEISIKDNLSIKIKYSKTSRKIWLEDNKKTFYKLVKKLKHNTNPELVGSEDSIRFTSRQPYLNNGVRYFGLIFAERSQQGDGTGQCGAGVEEYFVAYKKINNEKPEEIFRRLISSCKENIELDYGDGNNNDLSVTSTEGDIIFRWLTFPGTDLYIIGRYNYLLNTITHQEIDRSLANSIDYQK